MAVHIICRHSAQSFVKGSVLCECILFTVLYVTLIYMCVEYIQDTCRIEHGIADHAPTHVAHVTKAA
jgi:cytochrome bd-type quinol oxidase subunit 1